MTDNLSSTIRWVSVCSVLLGVGISHAMRPAEPRDPLTAALELCGDTPAPVEYRKLEPGRLTGLTAIEPAPEPYALAVKSVDDCRAKVLEHFTK